MVGMEKSPMTKGAGGLWRLGHCGFWFSGSDDLVWVSLPFLEVPGDRKPKASVLAFGDLITYCSSSVSKKFINNEINHVFPPLPGFSGTALSSRLTLVSLICLT